MEQLFSGRRAHAIEQRRERQSWPSDRPFRILSLDGGGIRGVYSASVLDMIENRLGGEPVADHVELIAGTSTGGILALGLGAKIPARDLLDFYKFDGREIFPATPPYAPLRWLQAVRNIFLAKHDHKVLERALKERFGDLRMAHSLTRLVIPALEAPRTQASVFKTDHHADYLHDGAALMRDVARATAAAPTYLAGLRQAEAVFFDGGLWANNPVMIGLVEALSAYDVDINQLEVLSIGTGNYPFVVKTGAFSGGQRHWLRAIQCAMHVSTDNCGQQAKLLLGPNQYLRLEPPGAETEIQLDDYDEAWARLPKLAASAVANNASLIDHFFRTKALPRERHDARFTH